MFFKESVKHIKLESGCEANVGIDGKGSNGLVDVVVEVGCEKMLLKIVEGRTLIQQWDIDRGYGCLDRKLAEMHGLVVGEARQLRLKHAGPDGDVSIVRHVREILREEIEELCEVIEDCLMCYNACCMGGVGDYIKVISRKKEVAWFNAVVIQELRERRRKSVALV